MEHISVYDQRILTLSSQRDYARAMRFLREVDSSAVLVNGLYKA